MRFEPLPTRDHTRWWDSPLVLAIAGTLAIHLILAVTGDAIVVFNPLKPDPPPAPKLELVDVEVPPVVKPPPPPVPQPAPKPIDTPKPAAVVAHHEPRVEPPPLAPPPPITTRDLEPSGGAPVVTEDNIAPSATGVSVATGVRATGHIGRGGTGTGTNTGAGAGSAAPTPVSVATIKTRALPRGDYSYDEAKDYPAEAKQLGIEGKIRVKLIVDATGAVKSAQLLNRLGHGLDELALARANKIVFDPARDTDDKPVASVVVWTFDLTLPK